MREEILYTPEEISQKLKLSKYTVYEMIKRGEIPAHRIGRSLRISSSQYEAYLTQSTLSDNFYDAVISVDDDGEKCAHITGPTGSVDLIAATDIIGPARVTIKPEDVIISKERITCSARNNIEGTITGMDETSLLYKLHIDIGISLSVYVTKRTVKELSLSIGDKVFTVFKATSVIVV